LQTCVTEAFGKSSSLRGFVYFLDVDSMDCDMIFYGTGTPVAKGFDQRR
jgi:arginase